MAWYVVVFLVLAILFGVITGVALWRLMRSMAQQPPRDDPPPRTPGP